MSIVGMTNRIALAAVALLVYWVFVFVTSMVFGFKVFRENMTELFLLSVVGIVAILFGAAVLNIMLNLTAIAEGRAREGRSKRISTVAVTAFAGSFVVLFLILYAGDALTAKKKEEYLVSAASDLIKEHGDIVGRLADYAFSRDYIERVSRDIRMLSEVEEKFPRITVIVRDRIEGRDFLLGFSSYTGLDEDEEARKVDYILGTSSEERKYLYSVLEGETFEYRFSASDGRYEVYYPIRTDKGNIVIHLSQYSKYGKIGS